MAPFYHRPENALKRAEELIAVGQQQAALNLLHDVILSKKFRSTPISALEPIMLRFMDLCVELRRGKLAKEGLHQYKNVSQNVAVATIELVIKRFIEGADAQVTLAQSKAEKITLDAVEDLEASETPESILMSSVSADVNKDRTDRQVVTPWLKFLWEAYRTALDILRNNARLEILYQTVVNQAFLFCLKYGRKTEFRRLCEILRQHLSSAAKYAHQTYSINLNEPDTLQRHLDTRFVQLNAAAELELWQEAFRSVEDIYTLLAMSKKAPKPFMMANYYEKLARIFMVGENYLFHAAAWNKYYATVRQNKVLTEEEHQRMASMVLISSLSIPIISSSSQSSSSYLDMDEAKHKLHRLSTLLRVVRPPSREALLKDALNKNIFSRVRPELKELYNILEVQFHPLSICKKIEPIMASIQKIPELAKYAKPLQSVVLTRLLQQLSQVYTTVKIDSVVKLAAMSDSTSGTKFDADKIEKFVMNGCRKGELSIRISHQTNTLTFETDLFAASKGTISEGPRLQSLPSEQMRLQLTRLAKRLQTACVLIDPQLEKKKQERIKAIKLAKEMADKEHEDNITRRLLIEKKKELKEYELSRIEREEALIRLKKEQEMAEIERIRLEAESKKREEERIKAHRAEIEKQETKKLAEKITEDLRQRNLKINIEDIENLDADKLVQLQLKQLEQEKQELQNKLKQLWKKHDHLERAFRKEEIPLLTKDYEDQKKIDKAYYVAMKKAKLEAAKIKYQESMDIKNRVMKMKPLYDSYKKQLVEERKKKYETLQKEAAQKLEEAKEKRRKEYIAKKEAELARKEKEAEEERKRIEREKQEAEKRAKEEKAREEREKAKRAEEEEMRRKLDEQARKQAERERLAEEKIRASRKEAPTRTEERTVPGEWRSSRPEPVAAASTGKYVPPMRQANGEGGGWRSRTQEERSRRDQDSRGDGRTDSADAWRRGGPPSRTDSADGRRRDAPPSRTDSGDAWRRDAPSSRTTDSADAWRRDGPPSSRYSSNRDDGRRSDSPSRPRSNNDGFTEVRRGGNTRR